MQTIVAHSEDVETVDAAREIIAACRAQLGDEPAKGAILFASVEYEHDELLRLFQEEWPGLPLVGGSSDGELSSVLGFRHDSVVLTLFAGADVEAHAGLGRNLSEDVERGVAQAFEGFAGREPALCVSVFAPTADGSSVVRSVTGMLPEGCLIVGGMAGDHRESMSNSKEFFCGEVLSDSLPILLLSGDFQCGWGSGSGWFPVGREYEVTRSEGHVVHEIDGRPAIDIYQDYYGAVPRNSSLGEYPLAVYTGEGEDDWCLRAILDSDAETGTVRFAGEVPTHARVRLTEVLPEGLLAGSTESLENALTAYAGADPELALIFSCAARKWVLGTEAEAEIDHLTRCAAEHGVPGLAIAGLYVFGEVSPTSQGTLSRFHNETCVSLILGR